MRLGKACCSRVLKDDGLVPGRQRGGDPLTHRRREIADPIRAVGTRLTARTANRELCKVVRSQRLDIPANPRVEGETEVVKVLDALDEDLVWTRARWLFERAACGVPGSQEWSQEGTVICGALIRTIVTPSHVVIFQEMGHFTPGYPARRPAARRRRHPAVGRRRPRAVGRGYARRRDHELFAAGALQAARPGTSISSSAIRGSAPACCATRSP